ncbi:hypothetical protein [Nocardioides cynanchi]|uniref:hypothetical protein n=1 Tax=Nocardioides cynanchi TaxID=2558918 RepID=UPI0012466054|nr:hypothetical protein [Nocardioides cynanchi]
MLISARAASRIFEEETGLVRQQSRRVLLSGLAGQGTRAGGSLLYDEALVRSLARWPEADHAEVLAQCPGGPLVVRLGRGDERAAPVETLAGAGQIIRSQVRARIEEHGSVPLVATVCGYPVRLAELTGLAVLPGASASGSHWAQQRVAVEFREPSEESSRWTRQVTERRLVTGPGPAWLLLGSQPYAGTRRTA